VKKTYDKARTPYQRLLDSSCLSEETKAQLRKRYYLLNPAQLKRQMEKLQQKLVASSVTTDLRRGRQRVSSRSATPAVEMTRLRKTTKGVVSRKRLEKSGKRAA